MIALQIGGGLGGVVCLGETFLVFLGRRGVVYLIVQLVSMCIEHQFMLTNVIVFPLIFLCTLATSQRIVRANSLLFVKV